MMDFLRDLAMQDLFHSLVIIAGIIAGIAFICLLLLGEQGFFMSLLYAVGIWIALSALAYIGLLIIAVAFVYYLGVFLFIMLLSYALFS